jgi:hypothetical protein
MENFSNQSAEPTQSTYGELATRMASDICQFTPDIQNEMLRMISNAVKCRRRELIDECLKTLDFLKATYDEFQ